ncbi:MAG: Ig-like domain-containing protein [Lachnospiraceae bacterium]|nr:Ig-like domain-containing protein [Lachnospiraceae bacterium]
MKFDFKKHVNSFKKLLVMMLTVAMCLSVENVPVLAWYYDDQDNKVYEEGDIEDYISGYGLYKDVLIGDDVTLKMEDSTFDGKIKIYTGGAFKEFELKDLDVVYKWYKEGHEESRYYISETKTPSYTIESVTAENLADEYECEIEDSKGKYLGGIDFNLCAPKAPWSIKRNGGTYDDGKYVVKMARNKGLLNIDIVDSKTEESYNQDNFIYQWQISKCINEDDDTEEKYTEFENLDNTTNTLEISRPKYAYHQHVYRCLVTDQAGKYTKSTLFYVERDEKEVISLEYAHTVQSVIGKPVTLKVSATSELGLPLHYTWMIIDNDYDDEYSNKKYVEVDDTVDSPSYTPKLNDHYYRCVVRDDEGNEATANYYINYPDILVENDSDYDRNATTYLRKGAKKQLSVQLTDGIDYNNVSYQWKKYDRNKQRYVDISGANSSDYIYQANVAEETKIRCYATVTVGDKSWIDTKTFYLKIYEDAGLIAFGETKTVKGPEPKAYTFTPSVDGDYKFEADYYYKDADPGIVILDENGLVVKGREGYDFESYFYIKCSLTAGKTYYMVVKDYEQDNKNSTFKITVNNGCEHKNTSIKGAKSATCGVVGYTGDKYCNDCKILLTKGSTIPATGKHSWDNGTVTKTATCVTTGVKTYKCKVCGTTKKESIAKTNKHSYGAWTTTKKATVLATGLQQRKCTVCGNVEKKTINKLKATIKVNVSTIPLAVKQTTSGVKVTYQTGDGIKSWKSNNTKVATVNSKGKITGKKAGTAKITVTLKSGKDAVITVKVQKKAVATTKVAVNSKSINLNKGKKFTLKTTVTPITSKQKVTYKTSNKKIATVSSKGVITAKKKGTAKITVKSGKKSVKVTVKVK